MLCVCCWLTILKLLFVEVWFFNVKNSETKNSCNTLNYLQLLNVNNYTKVSDKK